MKYIALTLVAFLAGCSLTPEQAQALAAGMHSAGQGLSQEAAQMRQQMYQQNQRNSINMQPIAPMPMNCTTTYNSLMRAYETRCN
jgi:hypothetical protein